jgi:hypothetical protein
LVAREAVCTSDAFPTRAATATRSVRASALLIVTLREARLAAGLELRELAGRVGVSPSMMSALETGRLRGSELTREKLRAVVGPYEQVVRRLPPDDPRHGTVGGYTNWSCRCRACCEAHSADHLASGVQDRYRDRWLDDTCCTPDCDRAPDRSYVTGHCHRCNQELGLKP